MADRGRRGILTAQAQTPPPNEPTEEQLANDNKLFLSLATKALKWEEPAAVRIVGPCPLSAPRDSFAADCITWVEHPGRMNAKLQGRRGFGNTGTV